MKSNMCGVHSAALQLLSLCLFLTLSAVTLGQQHGPGVKVVVTEGDDALLPCTLSTKQNIIQGVFDLLKDAQKDQPRKEVFFYSAGAHYNNGRSGQSVEFKGRVFHFPDELKHGNTSIIIKDTKAADSGNYTCVFPRVQPPEEYYIELVVERVLKDRPDHEATKPYTSIVNVTLDGVLLQCEVPGAAPEPRVQWKDGAGNVLHAVKTQNRGEGGRFYISLFTTVTKTDVYRCVVTQEDIRHQTQAETFVPFYAATPEPYTRILNVTQDGALLQCEVRGATLKPRLQWQDSAGHTIPSQEPLVSERGGSYNITLLTTVNKTDVYRCVVTQDDIKHQTHAETFVPFCAATPEPYTRTLKATADWALLQCEVRGATLKPRLQWQDSAGHMIPSQEPLVSVRGGSYNITLLTTVNKTDVYRCVVTLDDIKPQTHAETSVHINEGVHEDPSGKVDAGWLVLALVLGAVIVPGFQALHVGLKRIARRCNKGRRRQENGRLERATFNQGNGSSKEPPEAVPLEPQDV